MARLSRTAKIVAGVWLAAAVTALPYPLYTRTYYYLQDPLSGRPISDSLICNIPAKWVPQMRRIFQFSTFSMFVLPMTLITVLYVHIGITVRRSVTRSPQQMSISAETPPSSAQTTPKRPAFGRQSSRKSVTNMLVAVVVAFFVCWAPFHAQRLMTVYVSEDQWTHRTIELQSLLFYVSGILYFVSCTVNPILYNLLSHKYRRAFSEVLCGGGCSSSSVFARWRRISIVRGQTSCASHSLDHRRGRADQQHDGTFLKEGDRERVAVGVALPRAMGYGSARTDDINLGMINPGIIELGMMKPRIIEVGNAKQEIVKPRIIDRGITDQGIIGKGITGKGIIGKEMTDQGIVDQGIVDKGIVDQGIIIDQGITDQRIIDQRIIDQGIVEQRSSESDTIEARCVETSPTESILTSEHPTLEIIETGTSERGILKPETSVNLTRRSIKPGYSGDISQKSRCAENCHLAVRRIVQKVRLSGDAVTKYESFLPNHGDQRSKHWRQAKQDHRGQKVIWSNNVV